MSTASVSLSQPKTENYSLSHPVLKNKNVNLFNDISSLDDGPANILISSSTNTDSNSTPTDISLQSNNRSPNASDISNCGNEILSPHSPEFVPSSRVLQINGDNNSNFPSSGVSTVFTSQSAISSLTSSNASQPVTHSTLSINPKFFCIFCNSDSHSSHCCHKFNSSQDFWFIILSEKRCKNCFRHHHQAVKCYDNSFCKLKYCRRSDKHSPVLCRHYFKRLFFEQKSSYGSYISLKPNFNSFNHKSFRNKSFQKSKSNYFTQGTQTESDFFDSKSTQCDSNVFSQATQTRNFFESKNTQFPEVIVDFDRNFFGNVTENSASTSFPPNVHQINFNEISSPSTCNGFNSNVDRSINVSTSDTRLSPMSSSGGGAAGSQCVSSSSIPISAHLEH